MTQPLRILLLEDCPLDAELALAHLSDGGFACNAVRVETRAEFERALIGEDAPPAAPESPAQGASPLGCAAAATGSGPPPDDFDLILADHFLPTFDGVSALNIARARRPDLPFIFVSGTLGEEVATEAIKSGATDYVLKHRMERLTPSVRRALREAAERAELRRTQAALRMSEIRSRLLIESATDFAVIVLDPDGTIAGWAGGAEQITGYAEAEVVGQPFNLIFTAEDQAAGAPRRELERARRDGRSPDDRWHRKKNGERFFASGVTTALPQNGEGPCGFVKIVRDVTEKQQQDESLRRSNEKLRILSELASQLLRHVDSRENLAAVFDQLSGHLGLEVYLLYQVAPHPTAPGRQCLRLFASANLPGEDVRSYEQLEIGQGICGKVVVSGRPIVCEDLQRREDQATSIVRAAGISAYACFPLRDDGKTVGSLSFGTRNRARFEADELELMQTVSDQVALSIERSSLIEREQEARRQAEQSARQAEQLAREAERSARQAEEANRAKDEFLATVSHELRTPLTAMLGWARILRGEAPDQETLEEGLETIERNADAQAELIDDILDISRIETGKLRMTVGPVDLAPLIQDALDAVRPAADARRIGVRMEIEGAGGFVAGDPDRLRQVVWNLLTNAIKFTPSGGSAAVTLHRDESRARLTVADTGRGVAPEFLPFIFERFRQGDASSTRRHGGLGLGLAICRHLVELHGGTIDVASEGEGKGASFTVTLPLMAPRADSPSGAAGGAAPGAVRPQSHCSSSTLQGITVLLVDDEADARRMMGAVLERAGAGVVPASSVAEALAELEHRRFDVVVSDIGMPDEDGYSLIRRLRQRSAEAGGSLPAAALTAYTRPADRSRVMQSGFQLYLSKPIEPAALVAAVRELAGAGDPAAS